MPPRHDRKWIPEPWFAHLENGQNCTCSFVWAKQALLMKPCMVPNISKVFLIILPCRSAGRTDFKSEFLAPHPGIPQFEFILCFSLRACQ